MRPPASKSDRQAPTKHHGFDRHGLGFTSEVEITNDATRWVRRICTKVREAYWTPAMVIDSLRNESETVQNLLLPETIASWSTIDRYHLWPLAWSGSSLARTIMHQGKGPEAPWTDEWAWSKSCDAAEAKHGHPSRFEGHHHDPEELLKLTNWLSS